MSCGSEYWLAYDCGHLVARFDDREEMDRFWFNNRYESGLEIFHMEGRMTDYNDGKWHGWNGGECPVHPKTEVGVKFLNSGTGWIGEHTGAASESSDDCWRHAGHSNPIIAFRVTKPYVEPKKPREVWMRKTVYGWMEPQVGLEDAVLFREVLPD